MKRLQLKSQDKQTLIKKDALNSAKCIRPDGADALGASATHQERQLGRKHGGAEVKDN